MAKFNKKTIARIYEVSVKTIHNYMRPHRKQLQRLATTYIVLEGRKKRTIYKKELNSRQLKYIVEKIMKDEPPGYIFNGKTFIPEQ